METNMIIQKFEGKTILVIGATGFLAKILMEKILRVQPNIRKLFVLIRASNVGSAEQRLYQEIVDTELFRVLKDKWGENFKSFLSSKVIPVPGNVTEENLGIINAALIDEMWGELDFIINSAATTRFDETYDVALDINAIGALHVLNFAKRCSKLKLLLHVSTAYLHGTRAGVLAERRFHMGDTIEGAKASYLDIEAEKKLVDETKMRLQTQNVPQRDFISTLRDLGIQRANLHGWPNTYSFTKAMGEMLLENFKENVHVIILRPPIITSTCREPFPGWMEGLRTIDSVFAGYAKGKLKFFLADPQCILDMIPADMVVNSLVVAIAVHSHDLPCDDELKIYQIGSSLRNPINIDQFRWLMYYYLKKNPFSSTGNNKEKKPIKVGKVLTTVSSMPKFHRYIRIHYVPLLKVLKVLNVILCKHYESSYANSRQKIKYIVRFAKLYEPYTLFHGIFNDANTEKLRITLRESEANEEMFEFDPKYINWDEYFINTHFPGIMKYVLKQ